MSDKFSDLSVASEPSVATFFVPADASRVERITILQKREMKKQHDSEFANPASPTHFLTSISSL
jgi:hypothetical protein